MGTPNPDQEIQGKLEGEMPYAQGLQNVDVGQGGLAGFGMSRSLKCSHASIIQANAWIAPDIKETWKDIDSVVFAFLGSDLFTGSL